MFSKLYKYKFNIFIEYLFIFCLSLHIFFWGSFQLIQHKIKLSGISLLNPKISIVIIFFYLLGNYKLFFKSNLSLIFAFSILLLHLLFNFDSNFFIYNKLLKFLIIFIIFIVCNNCYDLIIKNLEKIIFLFLTIIFIYIIYDFFEVFFLNKLKNNNNLLDLIFSENSHFAIAAVPVIFFLLFNRKQFSFSSILSLVVTFFSLFNFYSTTLIIGLSSALLFSFVFCFNEISKRFVLIVTWIIVCVSTIYFSNDLKINHQKNFYNDEKLAFFKLTESYNRDGTLKNLNKYHFGAIEHLWPEGDYKNFENKYFYDKKCEDLITYKNYSNKWKNQHENIGVFLNANYICLPLRRPDKLDLIFNPQGNLSIEVFMNSVRIAFFSVKEKFYGYGINNYDSAFAAHMINNIVPSYYKEVFILNFNDASSSFTKLISEFGIFSIFFFWFLLKYSLNDKILVQHKLFFISIILTQFYRGVGYANGGFALAFAMILIYFFRNYHFNISKNY
jgi:hypothetical protein